jgi:ABC-2 type transport system ATP-binding protein
MTDANDPKAPVLAVRALSHSYKRIQALKSVTFTVTEGSIHGFVGPNGAGKTTTLKILATLLKPQAGTVAVFGHDIARDYKKVRRRIGYMPDHFGLYRQMTVFETLDFFAAAYGMRLRQRDSVIGDILRLVDLDGRRNDLVRTLSRGMLQRLSLGRSLVHDPMLLLLDEPASGLDPRARIELMEILKELGRMGKTIFISSHILGELADLCDSVTIIDRGAVRYSGSMAGLLARSSDVGAYVLTVRAEDEAVENALRAVDGVTDVSKVEGRPSYRVTLDAQKADANAILRAVLDTGVAIAGFEEDRRKLSEAFLELTEPGVPS